MKSALILLLLLTFLPACSTVGEKIEMSSMNNLEQQTEPSDAAIRSMFLESGLGDGDGFLEELKEISNERVASVVQAVKKEGLMEGEPNFGVAGADEKIRMKAAYYLATIGVDVKENQDYILDRAKSKEVFLRIEALEYIAAFVGSGKKELLPVLFAEAPNADGHLAELLTFLFVDEAQNSTEPFLKYLAKQPKKERNAVARLIADSDALTEPGTAAVVFAKIEPFKGDRELGQAVSELLTAGKPSKRSP